MHLDKTQTLLLSESARSSWAATVEELGFALAPACTPQHARYLGFELDVDGRERELAKQVRRVEDWVRWAAGLPSGVGLRVVRYGMYCHSILRYWLALLSPTEALRHAERRWAAIVVSSPMHAVPLEDFAPAALGGIGKVFPTCDTTHVSAIKSFLPRSQVFGDLVKWWDVAHSREDVALRWMGTRPEERRALGHLLRSVAGCCGCRAS